MKKILIIITVSLNLIACDPIYYGELRNNTGDDIEIKVCGESLSFVNYDNSGTELKQLDTISDCKIIILNNGKNMPIAIASGIAKPIKYEDLGFNEVEITTKDGKIKAIGPDIMSLFKIEEKTNFIGIHTYDLYHIDIGQIK